MIFLAVAKKLCGTKSDRVGGTPNQIPPTDEIMPDLNHSVIYNAQNSQKTFIWVRTYILNRVVRECQKRIKSTKRITQTSISRKKYSSSVL